MILMIIITIIIMNMMMNNVNVHRRSYQVAFLLPPTGPEKVSAQMFNCKGKQTRAFWAIRSLDGTAIMT